MFILDRPGGDAPTYIFLLITLSDGRLKYPVKAKAHPRDWSGQRCKDRAVNAVLNRVETKVAEMIQDATVRNYPLTRSAVRLSSSFTAFDLCQLIAFSKGLWVFY